MTTEDRVESLHAALRDLLREIGSRAAGLNAWQSVLYRASAPTGNFTSGRAEDAGAMLAKAREILAEVGALEPVAGFSVETVERAIADSATD